MICPKKREFNYDTAIRYKPIVEKIENSKWRKYPVLEIGSGGSGISDFYSGQVIGVDTNFSKTGTKKNQNIRYVKGSILKLPFQKNSFYHVVCMDVLEHIPENNRKNAIKEMLRVIKKGGKIYLGFPTGGRSLKVENLINHLFKKTYGKDHLWLLEHKKNGLPKLEDIKIIIFSLGIKENKIDVLNNANLLSWFLVHLLITVYPGKFFSRALKLLYKQLFILLRINLPPYYRVILTINK